MGRIKTFKNGPRIIDIDILLYWEKKIFTPILTVPHIWITERDFVAYPLYDIDPSLRINEETIKSIIKKIPNNLKPFIL